MARAIWRTIDVYLTPVQASVLRVAIESHRQFLEDNGMINSVRVLDRIREKLDAAERGDL